MDWARLLFSRVIYSFILFHQTLLEKNTDTYIHTHNSHIQIQIYTYIHKWYIHTYDRLRRGNWTAWMTWQTHYFIH